MGIGAPWRVKQTEPGRAEAPMPPWSLGHGEIRSTMLPPESPEPIEEEVVPDVKPPSLPRQATPRVFEIGTLLDDRLRLRIPIKVELEREGDFYIVRWGDVDEFGYGHDPMLAVDDLRLTLAELYWTLDKEQERLSADLATVWDRLRDVIERR